jgi:hypothetical protein
VTVKTGHSVSTVILSPDPIEYAWVTTPDLLVILSEEGAAKAAPIASRMGAGVVYSLGSLTRSETAADVRIIDLARTETRIGPADVALAAIAAVANTAALVPLDALLAAATHDNPRHTERNRELIQAGWPLATP